MEKQQAKHGRVPSAADTIQLLGVHEHCLACFMIVVGIVILIQDKAILELCKTEQGGDPTQCKTMIYVGYVCVNVFCWQGTWLLYACMYACTNCN